MRPFRDVSTFPIATGCSWPARSAHGASASRSAGLCPAALTSSLTVTARSGECVTPRGEERAELIDVRVACLVEPVGPGDRVLARRPDHRAADERVPALVAALRGAPVRRPPGNHERAQHRERRDDERRPARPYVREQVRVTPPGARLGRSCRGSRSIETTRRPRSPRYARLLRVAV